MTVVLLLTRHGRIDCPGCMHPSDPPDNRDSDCIKQQQYIRHCQWSRCRCMITYHMRCPENGDTQRQAVEPGKPLCCVRAGMQIFTRASASNSTFLFHGGPSPRRSTRPPSLAPPASSPPGGGRRGGARRAVTRAEVASRARAASVELEFPFSREGIDEYNRM